MGCCGDSSINEKNSKKIKKIVPNINTNTLNNSEKEKNKLEPEENIYKKNKVDNNQILGENLNTKDEIENKENNSIIKEDILNIKDNEIEEKKIKVNEPEKVNNNNLNEIKDNNDSKSEQKQIKEEKPEKIVNNSIKQEKMDNKLENKEQEDSIGTQKEESFYFMESESENKDVDDKKQENIIKEKKPITIKSCKNLMISENVFEFLPEDISKEEIKNMVYNSLGNSIVDDKLKYIKGKNLTKEQVKCIIDILYMNVIHENNSENNYGEILGDAKIKIRMCDINKENVKNIIFKNNKNPDDEDVDEMLNQLTSSSENMKLFVIELLD